MSTIIDPIKKIGAASVYGTFKTPIKLSKSQIQKAEDYKRMHTPIVRTTRKIGRNDPCPCGSGRKYKKCHGG